MFERETKRTEERETNRHTNSDIKIIKHARNKAANTRRERRRETAVVAAEQNGRRRRNDDDWYEYRHYHANVINEEENSAQ